MGPGGGAGRAGNEGAWGWMGGGGGGRASMRVAAGAEAMAEAMAEAGAGAGAGVRGRCGAGGAGAHDGDHGVVGEVVAAEPESLQPRGAARLSQRRSELGGRGVVEEIVAQIELLELRGIVRRNTRVVW